MAKFIFILSFCALTSYAAQVSLKDLGDQEFKKNNFRKACEMYSQALQQDPRNSSLYMNRGLAHFKSEDYDQAIHDFTFSLVLKKTGKAYHWLGRSYLQKNDLSRGYYFLSQAENASDFVKDNQVYLAQAQKLFHEKLQELEHLKQLKTDRGNFLDNYKKVRGYHYSFIENQFFTSEYGQLVNSLAGHWRQREYNHLAVMENPAAIAELMGSGKHVATVIVQTIPFHLSTRFVRVSVFDTAKPQIEFHNRLAEAVKNKTTAGFINKAEQELRAFLAQHKDIRVDQKISDRIAYEFKKIYKFADNHVFKDTMQVFHQDIFAGVDADPTIDVVFLSSIPFLKLYNWQSFYYPKIRQWLEMKKTVVFSILGTGLYVDAIFQELTERFDDVALMDSIVFEQTPTTIHVKLTPKN